MEFIFDGFRRQTENPEEDEMLDTKIFSFSLYVFCITVVKNIVTEVVCFLNVYQMWVSVLMAFLDCSDCVYI